MTNGLTFYESWTIRDNFVCFRGIGAQEKVSGKSASGSGQNKVCSIGINMENYVACVIPNGGIRMPGDVVQELGAL